MIKNFVSNNYLDFIIFSLNRSIERIMFYVNIILNKIFLSIKSYYSKSIFRKITNFISKFLIIFLFLFLTSDVFAGCGDNANPALKTLCDILRLLHGRLGRAFVMVTVIMNAFQFAQGGVKWQNLVTLFIGIGMFWAPKTVALYVLPNYITGVQGEGYTPNQILSPDEIISCACPDLR